MARATAAAAASSGAWASQLKLLAMLTSLLPWERQRSVVIWKVSGIITMTPPPLPLPPQLTTMMICGKCSNSI